MPTAATIASPPPVKRLGDRLTEAGLMTPHQLELALREQKRTGRMIGRVLQELGFASEQAIAAFLAQDAQTPIVNVATLDIAPDTIALLPYEFCQHAAVLPVRHTAEAITVVMADPFDVVSIDRVEQITRRRIEVLNASKPDILEKLAALHEREGSLDQTIDELMKIGASEQRDDNIAPMIRAVEQILAAAVRKSASDIHFEPDDKFLRIRMRYDGMLQAFLLVPKDLQDAFLA